MDIDKVYYYETLQPVVRRHGFDPNFVLQDGFSLRANEIYALIGSPDPSNPRKIRYLRSLGEFVITPVTIPLDWWDKKYLKEKGLL